MKTAQRYVLRFCGAGLRSRRDTARVVAFRGVVLLDDSSPRMLLVQATGRHIQRLLATMPGWVASPETSVPLPAPRPHPIRRLARKTAPLLVLMAGLLLAGAAARAQTNAPSPAPSLEAIAKAFFEANPNREISQQEATSHILSIRPDAQDPWRTVRKLYQDGWLVKVRKGVYQRIPGHADLAVDEHFTPAVREEIHRRDNFRCVVCGNGPHNGHEIHADHIRPRQLGGRSTVENGQTLCSEHNLLKKTYGTYDFYAHLVSRLEKEARSANDARHAEMLAKIQSILRDYGYPSRSTPPDGSSDPSSTPGR